MSIFQSTNVESDIEKLRKREEFVKKYREAYGEIFIGVIWDDPDDPFCCSGRVMCKTQRVDQGIIYGPYIPTTVTPGIIGSYKKK